MRGPKHVQGDGSPGRRAHCFHVVFTCVLVATSRADHLRSKTPLTSAWSDVVVPASPSTLPSSPLPQDRRRVLIVAYGHFILCTVSCQRPPTRIVTAGFCAVPCGSPTVSSSAWKAPGLVGVAPSPKNRPGASKLGRFFQKILRYGCFVHPNNWSRALVQVSRTRPDPC